MNEVAVAHAAGETLTRGRPLFRPAGYLPQLLASLHAYTATRPAGFLFMLVQLSCITDVELTVRPDRGAGGGRSDRGGSDRGGSERRPDRRDDRDRDYRSRCVTGAAPAYWSHFCLIGQGTGQIDH